MEEFGKIEHISLGFGGYQDAQFGLTVNLGGKGWAVGDFKGYWGFNPDKRCKWTIEDQAKAFKDVMFLILKLLKEANVNDLYQLKGKPVAVIMENNTLKSWRLLTEVL